VAILPITVYGDKILWEKTKPVKAIDDELIVTIQDMFQTMRNANGIGLAANQVNINKQLFIVDVSPVEGCEHIKPVVMINPQIIETSDEIVTMEEGCLSLPDLRADVERPDAIKIRYLNTDEEEVEIEADELFARVILHEYDHLIGKMIPDRVAMEIKKEIQPELLHIAQREINVDYPITLKT